MKPYVELFEKSPIEALQKGLLDTFRIEWDGKAPLWQFIVEHVRQECLFARAAELFRGTFAEVDKAANYVEHYQQMSKLQTTEQIRANVAKCKEIVIGTVRSEPQNVPEVEAA